MSLSLYSIAEELLVLKQLRDDAEYEGNSEAVQVIDGQLQEWVRGCLAAKADGIRGYIRQLEEQRATWKEESDRFARLAKQAEAQHNRLKAYVLEAMRLLDTKKIAGSKGDVLLSRRGNGGLRPLIISQPELVPDRLRTTTVEMRTDDFRALSSDQNRRMRVVSNEPNAAAIRAILERREAIPGWTGEGVPGCHLEERGERLKVE
jgi:hypothetical protein